MTIRGHSDVLRHHIRLRGGLELSLAPTHRATCGDTQHCPELRKLCLADPSAASGTTRIHPRKWQAKWQAVVCVMPIRRSNSRHGGHHPRGAGAVQAQLLNVRPSEAAALTLYICNPLTSRPICLARRNKRLAAGRTLWERPASRARSPRVLWARWANSHSCRIAEVARARTGAYSCAVWHVQSKLDGHGDPDSTASFRLSLRALPSMRSSSYL
jgi:hypothetical protein